MKVFIVTSHNWNDEFHESSYDQVCNVFTTKARAEEYIKEELIKYGKVTKKQGVSFEIEEKEVEN